MSAPSATLRRGFSHGPGRFRKTTPNDPSAQSAPSADKVKDFA